MNLFLTNVRAFISCASVCRSSPAVNGSCFQISKTNLSRSTMTELSNSDNQDKKYPLSDKQSWWCFSFPEQVLKICNEKNTKRTKLNVFNQHHIHLSPMSGKLTTKQASRFLQLPLSNQSVHIWCILNTLIYNPLYSCACKFALWDFNWGRGSSLGAPKMRFLLFYWAEMNLLYFILYLKPAQALKQISHELNNIK